MYPEPKSFPALYCRSVSKHYGKQLILDAIDLDMREGEILGLLGPNGAGKTTLMKSIVGLSSPDDGEIRIFGHDIASDRTAAVRHVGAIVEAPVFPVYLTAYENLRYLSSLSGHVPHGKIMEVLELVGLEDSANRKVESFSYGMKQRLGIAQALLPDSKFLILDEPANGLDPHGIAGMRRLLKKLTAEMNVSVMVSSHLLHEVEQVCGRVIILNHGKKILDATQAELTAMDESVSITVQADFPDSLKSIQGYLSATPMEDRPFSVLRFAVAPDKIPSLVSNAVASGAQISSVEHEKSGLENIFINLTSQGDGHDRSDSF